jgi:peptidoglycan-associated lipoprotein
MKKFTALCLAASFVLMAFAAGGCARRGARHALLDEKGYYDAITEEELASLGIGPSAPARGMEFAGSERLHTVYFPFDSSDIHPETRRILDANVAVLEEHSRVVIMVEGHCDERGTVEYNLALGQRRAESVRRYLVASGINPDRIFTISYGKEKPVNPASNEQAWSENRRAEFKVRVR